MFSLPFIQPPRDGQDIQHGVHVLYDADKDIKLEPEHVLVVVLVLHHVLVHLLKEGLVEELEVSEHTFCWRQLLKHTSLYSFIGC